MKKTLKWSAIVVAIVALVGFMVFLYAIPPFLISSPETFSGPFATSAPPVDGVTDPKERAIAEHGRQIVVHTGCIGCHATNGPQGPDLTKYLAGGGLKFESMHGTFVSRNLTSDKETGLGGRSDVEIKRVLRSGVFPDGHVVPTSVMPWAAFANWTEEDRHAVVVYLRHLPAIKHQIPDRTTTRTLDEPGAIERGYGGRDYGVTPAQ